MTQEQLLHLGQLGQQLEQGSASAEQLQQLVELLALLKENRSKQMLMRGANEVC